MLISCPGFGYYTPLIEELADYLGWDTILPPSPTEESIELGTKYLASELMCLPAKVTLGSMIKACEQGATDLIMFDSCGLCRMKTYWILQQQVLRRLGFDVTIHPIRLGWRIIKDIKAIKPSVPYWKICRAFIKFLIHLVKLDEQLWVAVPEETNKVKVGITGEIYTVLEPAVNRDIIKKLGKMGVLVHNSLPLSYFIFKDFYNRGWMKRKGVDRQTYLIARERAHNLMPKEVGGHGNESIIHTIYYAMKHFDGVLHILPFPCSPEATVSPVLDNISHDYGVPVMRLIFDTHTAEAGLNTRLEAFIDILQRKKATKK